MLANLTAGTDKRAGGQGGVERGRGRGGWCKQWGAAEDLVDKN